MFRPVRTSAPVLLPVTLADAKMHLRIEPDVTLEDDLVTGLIAAATDHLDGWTGILGRALVTQSWRQDFSGFGRLRLPLGPVSSISSITYYDSANEQQTLAASTYVLRADAAGDIVELAADQTWPSCYSRRDAVSVNFVAGHPVDEVPAAIKAAINLLVGAWYENREETAIGVSVAGLPNSVAVSALLAPYRRVGI